LADKRSKMLTMWVAEDEPLCRKAEQHRGTPGAGEKRLRTRNH